MKNEKKEEMVITIERDDIFELVISILWVLAMVVNCILDWNFNNIAVKLMVMNFAFIVSIVGLAKNITSKNKTIIYCVLSIARVVVSIVLLILMWQLAEETIELLQNIIAMEAQKGATIKVVKV